MEELREATEEQKYIQALSLAFAPPPDRLWIGSGNCLIEFADTLVESGIRAFMYIAPPHT